MNIPNLLIEKYRTEDIDGEVGYPDIAKRAAFWDKTLSIFKNLKDDSIPSCYLSELDEGLYGGLLGGETKFIHSCSNGWISSMTVPFLKNLDYVEEFKLEEENEWFKRYKTQLGQFIDKADGKYAISHFVLSNGLNLFFELRGATNTYYDVMETPDKAGLLVDFAIKLNIWVHEVFFNTVGLIHGGTASINAQWLPGRIVFESVDPFHLTSPDMFEEWGRKPIQKVFDFFDGGIVHLHSNGHHLLENIISLNRLKCIVFYDEDFGTPTYMKLNSLSSKSGGIPMVIPIPYEVFVDKLVKKELPTNILYDVKGAPDVKTSNEVMDEVKNYRGQVFL